MEKRVLIENEKNSHRIVLRILWMMAFFQFPIGFSLSVAKLIQVSEVFFLINFGILVLVALLFRYFENRNIATGQIKYYLLFYLLFNAGFICLTYGNDIIIQFIWAIPVFISCLYFDPKLTLFIIGGAIVGEVVVAGIAPVFVNPGNLLDLIVTTGLILVILFVNAYYLVKRTQKLFNSLLDAKDELNKTNEELKERYLETIWVLRLAVDEKDDFTRGHSDRVAYYAVKIGESFGLTEKELGLLKIGGIFHDIGKMKTVDDILLKNGSLSEIEYQEIKKHPIKGAHILSAVSMFREVIPLVKFHHEWIDGSGYPEGLKGEDIPFLAKILAVADAYDAMSSNRRYRSKLELDETKKQLVNGAGTQFDSEIVSRFIQLLENIEQMEKELEARVWEEFPAISETIFLTKLSAN
jgi:putative nucleotidyltransferase with HDIG domain